MKRAVIALAALTLTACSSGSTVALTAAHDANNVRVCGHYRTQRAYIKGLAEPAVADAVKFEMWVAADAAQATPGTPVARDLAALSKAQRNYGPVYAVSTRVLNDCTALGVKFQP